LDVFVVAEALNVKQELLLPVERVICMLYSNDRYFLMQLKLSEPESCRNSVNLLSQGLHNNHSDKVSSLHSHHQTTADA
jgi:polysaccharide pyruvyl transferase WcaK-like protein